MRSCLFGPLYSLPTQRSMVAVSLKMFVSLHSLQASSLWRNDV